MEERKAFKTILPILVDNAQKEPDTPALKYKKEGQWQEYTWQGYYDQVRTLASCLSSLGLTEKDGIGILSNNRPEWFFSHLASVWLKLLSTGLYTTGSSSQWSWILNHLEAKVLFVENEELLEKFETIRNELPSLQWVILFDGQTNLSKKIIAYSDLLDEEKRKEILQWDDNIGEKLDGLIVSHQPDDIATIIYTSGTTGNPKGVMLTHKNLCYMSWLYTQSFPLGPYSRFFSFLPLSHIADMIITLYTAMMQEGCTYFAESMDTVVDDLQAARPNILLAVPRVFEKIHAKMKAKEAHASLLKKMILAFAKHVGFKYGDLYQRGHHHVKKKFLYRLADKLVFSKVKKGLGLDAANAVFSAGAPLPLEVGEYFLSMGIHLPDAYGLSETCGATTFAHNEDNKVGYAGKIQGDFQVKIASDDEVLVKGPHIFKGYYKDPDNTALALQDGWFHTGDLGELDEEGYLKIIGRKKELVVTSGGKNIAPVPIEDKIKRIKGVQDAIVVGDKKPYLTALITVDTEEASDIGRAIGLPEDPVEIAKSKIFKEILLKQVLELNHSLGRFETIKNISILAEPLSLDRNELTPTMKLKRDVIARNYIVEIDEMYQKAG